MLSRARHAAVVAAVLVNGCGGRGVHTETAATAAGTAEHTAAPCVPAAQLAVDLARVEELRDAIAPDSFARIGALVDDVLNVDTSALVRGDLIEELGLPRAGLVDVTLCAIDSASRVRLRAFERINSGSPDLPATADAYAEARRVIEDGTPGFIELRFRVPVVDYARFLPAGLFVPGPGSAVVAGYETVTIDPREGVVIASSRTGDARSGAGSMLVEIWVDPFAAATDAAATRFRVRAISMLQARQATRVPVAPLDVGGFGARLTVVPDAIAELNFLLGMGSVARVLRAEDSERGAAIFAEGLREASRSLELAGGAASDRRRSRHLVVGVSGRGRSEIRADLGAGALSSIPALAPRPGIGVRGASHFMAMSLNLRAALPLGRNEGANLFDRAARFEDSVRVAGGMGAFIDLPSTLLLAAWYELAMKSRSDAAESAALRYARFDEIAVARLEGELESETVAIGLVGEHADARAAACAFYADGRTCLETLTADTPIRADGERTVLLTRVGARSVILIGTSQQAPQRVAAQLELLQAARPFRVAITDAAIRGMDLAEVLSGICGGAMGDARVDESSLVFSLVREDCGATRR